MACSARKHAGGGLEQRGDPLYVEGRLQDHALQAEAGKVCMMTEIVAADGQSLGRRKDGVSVETCQHRRDPRLPRPIPLTSGYISLDVKMLTRSKDRCTISLRASHVLAVRDSMKEFISTISSKGQVTIPADVRRQLGVRSADKVAFVVTDAGTVEVRPARFTLESVLGSLDALPGESVDLDREIEEAVEEGVAQKMRHQEGR